MHLNKRLYLGPGNEREQKHALLSYKKRTEYYCECAAFSFATMISACKRKPEGKKRDFFRFSMMLEMVFFVFVQILKKITKKLIYFLVYWISQFGAHSTQCSQLTVKAMFARLRKLQCFKATL